MDRPHPATGKPETWRDYIATQNYSQADLDLLLLNRACDVTQEPIGYAHGLVLAGANKDYNEGSGTPLVNAIIYFNWGIANMLMDNGCDLDNNVNGSGFTAAIVLVRNNPFSKDMFEKFFDLGFDPMVTDTMGRNVLDHAMEVDNKEALQIMLDRTKTSHLPELRGVADPDEGLFGSLAEMTEETRDQIVAKKIAQMVERGMATQQPVRTIKFSPKKRGMQP